MTASDFGEILSSDDRGRPFWYRFIPSILGFMVMAGGWVYNFATNQAQIRDLDRRVAVIEQTYVPKAVQEAKDAGRAERDRALDERLGRIEDKLDRALGRH